MAAQPDTITHILGARVQHGHLNDRVYVMDVGDADARALVPALDALARDHDYGKIFAKIPASLADIFMKAGYQKEAAVPNFYRASEDCFFLGKYFKADRARLQTRASLDQILKTAQNTPPLTDPIELNAALRFRVADASDAHAISAIYRQVFASYPFPIHDPEFILNSMRAHVRYYAIWHQDQIVALSSAEIDRANQNVEMTDFATLPRARGQRLSAFLLQQMDHDLARMGFFTAYTIARAESAGMNTTFARCGYRYGGTLINNTQIAGALESMHVWYKSLRGGNT